MRAILRLASASFQDIPCFAAPQTQKPKCCQRRTGIFQPAKGFNKFLNEAGSFKKGLLK